MYTGLFTFFHRAATHKHTTRPPTTPRPRHGGVQLAVDITLRSALSCDGQAHPHAADKDGAVLLQARRDKETTYPELASSGRCKLVVLAIETGGRWSEEAVQTMKMLAHSKARDAPSYMQFPSGSHVGAKVDENAGRCLRCVLRRVLGRTCAELVLVSH